MITELNTNVVPQAQPLVDALAEVVPSFETERMALRAPQMSDWPTLEPIFTTERGKHIGGPKSPEDAWLDFNQMTASWLLRGYGALTMVRKRDEAVLGLILIEQELGDPEPELGWLLTEQAEGHGYATEAAIVLKEEALRLFGNGGFVSYIAAENSRSVNVAKRLSAIKDDKPHPADPEVLVYRYGAQA